MSALCLEDCGNLAAQIPWRELPVNARNRLQRRKTAIERFEANYIPEPNSGCWLWLKSGLPCGYGQIYFDGKLWLAHRAAWHLLRGPIPLGSYICHHCDNPYCVNPDHLYVGDAATNNHDTIRRGRAKAPRPNIFLISGENSSHALLTTAQVLEIRASAAPHRELGLRYGVSRRTIRDVRTRRCWKHIP